MAPPRAGPSGGSLQYGKACLGCSRSKCKCIPRPGGQGCERCHRLEKSCIPGTSTRTFQVQKTNAIARIASLEGKFDDLVSLLGSGRAQTNNNTSSTFNSEVLSPPPSDSTNSPLPLDTLVEQLPDEDEAAECLAMFRGHMLAFFPFLHFPVNALQWLREQRPFLLLCITAAATKSTQRRLVLSERIRQTLAQSVFLDNDESVVSIDHLLGLLTFLAWGHDHLLHRMPARASRFTQLAMTIVFDLRLSKPLPEEMSDMLPVGNMNGDCSTQRNPSRSTEERRAVLATFVMSSIVSSYFGQIDAMQWTPYMEECLEVLSQNPESHNDEVFAVYVRLQLIAGDIHPSRSTVSHLPGFYITALQLKVDEAGARLSPALKHNEFVLSSTYYTQLSMYSLAMSKQNTRGFQKLESLCTCLNIIKSAFDNFFKIPASQYLGISFPLFTHLARNIVVLFRLSTLKDSTWDTSQVRSTIDLLQVMDQLISNLQFAAAMDGDRAIGGPLDRSIKIFTAVRSWCATRLAEGPGSTETAHFGNTDLNTMPLDDLWLPDNLAWGIFEGNNDLL